MRDLFALDAPPAATEARHKVFFALRPPRDVAERVVRFAQRLREAHGLTGRPTPADRLHISLNGLGRFASVPDGLPAAASQAMAGVEWPAFTIALDRCGSWGRAGARPLVLCADDGVIGVRGLHAALHARLVEAGLVRPRVGAFEPHLTLLRDPAAVALAPVLPFAWQVDEVVLLDSRHGEGRHDVLGRWTLARREPPPRRAAPVS